MKTFFISNNKNKIILFFNGWSMDYNHMMRLSSLEYDILFLYDYNNLSIDRHYTDLINKYSEVIVIGWSMGVFAAAATCNNLVNNSLSIAINGTLRPIDDKYGIPVNIFNATLSNFNENTREKFYKRMFKNTSEFEKFLIIQPDRTVENQKQELISLQNHNNEKKIIPNIFKHAIISKYDKIIPYKNQINFWQEILPDNYKIIEEGHYPFFIWESIEEIINYAKSNR